MTEALPSGSRRKQGEENVLVKEGSPQATMSSETRYSDSCILARLFTLPSVPNQPATVKTGL